MNIIISTENDVEMKISNVVFQNKKLQTDLEVAKTEIENLKQLLDAMSDLNSNLMPHDASFSDIQILNQLIGNQKNQIS